jgi:N-acetyl-beta-hexosaminidase
VRPGSIAFKAALTVLMCTTGSLVLGQAPPTASVIPSPTKVSTTAGSFTVSARTPVIAAGSDAERIARYLIDLVSRTRGLSLTLHTSEVSRAPIELRLDDGAPSGEGYELEVSARGVVVRAREPRGLFYGAVTLWQLMTADVAPRDSSVTLRALKISDAPRFAWRGFMLDSARHYQPPAFIKQMLDAMALHKLNTFQWHLTDDQGWRLQILKYPRLTEVGAWRVPAGAGPAADIDPRTGKPRLYGGFYTQDEVRDIVRYAAERFITVVPEIDMPGHAQAAIAAYPELGTDSVAPPVSSDWGIHTYLYNVDDATFSFLEDVLTEVIALFPSPYVHVGGDEAVKDRWRASPAVQQRMRQLGVADEAALQSYFTHRIEQFLRSKGRKLVGWDEILEGGELAPTATVMSWRGVEGGIEAVKQGHDVVMSPAPALYLDYLQSDLADEPPGRPTYVTLEDMYAFKVLPDAITGDAAKHVLGAQINAWTEHMRTPERVQHATFPRMAAFAEAVWSARADVPPISASSHDSSPSAAQERAPLGSSENAPTSDTTASERIASERIASERIASERIASETAASDSPASPSAGAAAPFNERWENFLHRLPAQFARYRKLGISYADSAFAVRIPNTTPVTLTNQVDTGEIRYTLTGSDPNTKSALYTTPITLPSHAIVTAATFINGHRVSAPRSRTFDRRSSLHRTHDELKSCFNKLVLRLEDDAPVRGERAVFNIDILDPCWIWEKADLSHATGIAAGVGQVPFNFQVGDDVKKIPLLPPQTPAGELEIRKDSCDGERIASLPLAPAAGNPQITQLPRTPLARAAESGPGGVHDLCLRFTRRSVDPIWAIQSVQLFD